MSSSPTSACRVVVIEPGFISPSMKQRGGTGGLAAYDELGSQLAQVAARVQSGGRPGPELVAQAVAEAIETEGGPLRRRVGDDADLILSARGTLGDEEFEKAMRDVVGLTW